MLALQIPETSACLPLQHLWTLHHEAGSSLYVDSKLHWISEPTAILSFHPVHEYRTCTILDCHLCCLYHHVRHLQIFLIFRAWSVYPVDHHMFFGLSCRDDDRCSACLSYNDDSDQSYHFNEYEIQENVPYSIHLVQRTNTLRLICNFVSYLDQCLRSRRNPEHPKSIRNQHPPSFPAIDPITIPRFPIRTPKPRTDKRTNNSAHGRR